METAFLKVTWKMSWYLTLCVQKCHLQTVAGLMDIGHLHLLMASTLAGRHLHLMEKVILSTSRTTCVVSILHLKMTWMITA
ncbi:MAG: hypothetical protein IJ615_07845 [Bacteroidaceae bacterium]|nr:hypothetical protein [Bacteroidaceae bacterium]